MKKILYLIVLPTLLASPFVAYLFFGNPQSSKYVYMTQAYIWPAERTSIDEILNGSFTCPTLAIPPNDFIGTWYNWTSSGTTAHKTILKPPPLVYS